ncbi:MAG: polyketide synthase [Blastochloris sp.]|nr:polyketide synthase [Blastochloris sp.]
MRSFWNNILNRVDAVKEVGEDRWDKSLFYQAGTREPGKVFCKYGGYLPGKIPFYPTEHGIMPLALVGAEPDQFVILQSAVEAFQTAGMDWRKLDGRRVGVVIGKGGYAGPGHVNYSQACFSVQHTLRVMRRLLSGLPEWLFEEMEEQLNAQLSPLTSETATTNVPNLVAARLANRMGFMGPNYTIDGACASGLIALDHAVQDLQLGKYDLGVVGGSHLGNDVFFIKMFEMIEAVSQGSKIRPFDRRADGTLPGEGAGVVLLKRLEDARREGDRILRWCAGWEQRVMGGGRGY